jgi:hypothetical protein
MTTLCCSPWRAVLSRGAPLAARTPVPVLAASSRVVHASSATTMGSAVRRSLGALRTLHTRPCLSSSGAVGGTTRDVSTHALAADEEGNSPWPSKWAAWEDFLHQCVAAGCFQEYEGVVMERSDVHAPFGLVAELGDAPAHKRGVLEFARKYGYLLECVPCCPHAPMSQCSLRPAADALLSRTAADGQGGGGGGVAVARP